MGNENKNYSEKQNRIERKCLGENRIKCEKKYFQNKNKRVTVNKITFR